MNLATFLANLGPGTLTIGATPDLIEESIEIEVHAISGSTWCHPSNSVNITCLA